MDESADGFHINKSSAEFRITVASGNMTLISLNTESSQCHRCRRTTTTPSKRQRREAEEEDDKLLPGKRSMMPTMMARLTCLSPSVRVGEIRVSIARCCFEPPFVSVAFVWTGSIAPSVWRTRPSTPRTPYLRQMALIFICVTVACVPRADRSVGTSTHSFLFDSFSR